jgi:hypothetical protein
LAAIGIYGGLAPFLQTTVVNTGKLIARIRLPAPSLEWSRLSEAAAFYLPAATYATVLAWAAKGARRDARWIPLLALSVYGLMAAASAWARTDRWHIFFALTPCLLLWAALPARIPGLKEKAASGVRLAALIAAAVALLPPYVRSLQAENRQRQALVPTKLARAGKTRLPFYQANGYEALVSAINQVVPAGEPFFFYYYNGAVYFLADRPSPCRTFDAVLPEQQRDVIADLEMTGVRWVVRDRHMTHFDGVPLDDSLSELSAYLRGHFHQKYEAGPFVFYERNAA